MVYDSGSCRWQLVRQVPVGGSSTGYTLVLLSQGEEPSRYEAVKMATGTFWQVACGTEDIGGPQTLRWNVWLHDGAEW